MEILIRDKVIEAIKALYGQEVDEKQVQVQTTRKEFTGDKTVVVFPFLRFSKKTAEETNKAGTWSIREWALSIEHMGITITKTASGTAQKPVEPKTPASLIITMAEIIPMI